MPVLILAQQIRLNLFTVILVQDSALRLAQIIPSDTRLSVNVYLLAKPIIICLYITWPVLNSALKVSTLIHLIQLIQLVSVCQPVLEVPSDRILQLLVRRRVLLVLLIIIFVLLFVQLVIMGRIRYVWLLAKGEAMPLMWPILASATVPTVPMHSWVDVLPIAQQEHMRILLQTHAQVPVLILHTTPIQLQVSVWTNVQLGTILIMVIVVQLVRVYTMLIISPGHVRRYAP